MKFFCVKTAQNTNNSRFNDMLKIVLQTLPELRSDDDHNKVFGYFNQDIYLNTFQKTRGIPKMMLAISVLEGLKVTSSQELMDKINQIQYLVVIEGSFQTNNQNFKEKSYILERELAKITEIEIEKDGCFIAYLSKQNYQKLLQFQLEQIKLILQSLKQFALFSDISHLHLLYLAAHTIPETYRFRQFVYKFGQESAYIYCIVSGPFELIRRFKKQKTNYESSITSIEGGQTFGQDCVFLKCNRESEIKSLSCDNFVYKIPSSCLVQVYNQYPQLKHALVATITERRAYIEKRAAEILQAHTNPSSKAKTSHEDSPIFFPKLKQSLVNKQKSEVRTPIKQKTHEEVGMELFTKAFNLNHTHILNGLLKSPKNNSKQNILKSLKANYLIEKLQYQNQDPKPIVNRSHSISNYEEQIKDNFIQLPLVESNSNKIVKNSKVNNKYQRFRVKHKFENHPIEPNPNNSIEFSLKKIFSLKY